MSSDGSGRPVTKTAPLPLPGKAQPVRFGKFLLVDRLGRGGMAEVWKARMSGPAGFQRTLVVKRILPHLVEDEHFVQMFVAEARLSARLNHANIVQVYELGDVDGEYYLAMEYVRGRDLVSVMRAQIERGRIDPGLAAYAIRDVCRALNYAHALTDDDGTPLRLIHRDVSPSNVMLGFDGAVKLLDFGIAKALSEANDNKTQTGTLKGKFGYMSPEQVQGRDLDHRTDIFAVGICLHETLTGKRLFKGASDLHTIALVRDATIDPPSAQNIEVGAELDRICLKALAREPRERYQTCEEMARDLDRVVHETKWGPEKLRTVLEGLFTNEVSNTAVGMIDGDGDGRFTVGTLRRWERRRRVAWAVAGLVMVSGLAYLGARALAPQPREPEIERAATTPPPTVPPPLPALARVRVTTTPPGAQVDIDATAEAPAVSGETPLTLSVPRSAEPRKLMVRLAGYRPYSEEIVPDTDLAVQVALQPDAEPKPPSTAHLQAAHKPPGKKSKAPATHASKPAKDLKAGDLADPFH